MKNLRSILRDGFFPHYCSEYSLEPKDTWSASRFRPPISAVPMVSFCDLPLSLIGKHLKRYGSYGIGLEKSWGTRNGVAPVIYTHSKAKTRPAVARLTNRARKHCDRATLKDLMFLAAYTKLFEGHAWRNGRVQKKKVRFYDEREWRYVPSIIGFEPMFLPFEDYEDIPRRTALHKILQKKHSLEIPPDVIQYLVVPYDKDESNILELHDFIMRLYGRLYSRKDAVLVSTTIMTDDRIKEDI